MNKNVIAVIDGAAGSCGKAKVVGEIATDKKIKLGAAITNCMPNAGHTFVSELGEKAVFRNIPVSIVNPETDLFIGPGSAIDMEVFEEDYKSSLKYLNDRKIYVHEMVPLIEERHKELERRQIKTGSTFKGGNGVTQEKIIRDEKLKFFKTYKNAICVSNDEWLDRLYEHLDNKNEYVILEGSQGCDLSLNHSGNYPYVTCRNVSTSQLLADSGISPDRLLETIMVIRPFPIRINNITKDGDIRYSGRYGNGEELAWTQINIASQEHSYPFAGDITSGWYDFETNLKDVKDEVAKMYFLLPEYLKKQLFGEYYNIPNFDNLSILKALEIERLYYKCLGKKTYKSIIIKDYFIDDLSEQTTVTRMERRIFNLDINKLKNNIRMNNPYGLYLNFFQQLDSDYNGLKGNIEDFYFDKNTIERYIDWLEAETNKSILAFGTGPKNNDRILVKSLIKEYN